MTVPGALEIIRQLRKEHPDLLIGGGTVLDPETARTCILEGAQFIVSPALNLATIERCREHGVPIFPGALTPTEIVTAWNAGGDVIKVFPVSAVGGAAYLKSIKAPLPQIELIPTGGLSLATSPDFLKAEHLRSASVQISAIPLLSPKEKRRESRKWRVSTGRSSQSALVGYVADSAERSIQMAS